MSHHTVSHHTGHLGGIQAKTMACQHRGAVPPVCQGSLTIHMAMLAGGKLVGNHVIVSAIVNCGQSGGLTLLIIFHLIYFQMY